MEVTAATLYEAVFFGDSACQGSLLFRKLRIVHFHTIQTLCLPEEFLQFRLI